MSPPPPTDFLQIFDAVEIRHDAKHWVCRDVHIWPLVKFMLAREIDDYVRGKNLVHISKHLSVSRWVGYSARVASEAIAARLADRSVRADICLLTYNTFRHYRVGARWFNIFQDPLRYFADEAGRSLHTLEVLNAYPARTPPLAPTASVSYEVSLAGILARAGASAGHADKDIEGIKAQLRAARQTMGLADVEPLIARVDIALRNLFILADMLEKIIRRVEPRRILMANYYSVSGLAACLAGHRLGIPVGDISHGSSGKAHYAYAGWHGHPEGGYEMLPRDFLSRHQGDAAVLDTLTRDSAHHRPAIVVGDIAALAWHENAFGLAAEARRLLTEGTNLSDAADDRLNVLVPVQSLDSIDPEILAAMREAHKWCRFWVRCHPIYLASIDSFEAPRDVDIPDIRTVTTAPLFALLERMDVVVTESSSVAEDGLSWGVPAIITHAFGQEMFSEHIASGRMLAASSGSEIVAALQDIVAKRRRPETNDRLFGTQKANLLQYLREI